MVRRWVVVAGQIFTRDTPADRSPDKSKRSSNTKLARASWTRPATGSLSTNTYTLYTYTSRGQYLFSYSTNAESVPSYTRSSEDSASIHNTGCFHQFCF